MFRTLEKPNNTRVLRKRPQRLRGLVVCGTVLAPIQRHLQTTGQKFCEEAAFLSGYVTATQVGIVTTAILPYTDHAGGGCSVPLDILAKCRRSIRQAGQIPLAAIHTHPGRHIGHSSTDDHWAICDAPGFLSIVVPCFARFGLARIFSGGAAIHERMPDGDWRQLEAEEVRKRFMFVPSNYVIV